MYDGVGPGGFDVDLNPVQEEPSREEQPAEGKPPSGEQEEHVRVDIRMIDFAKSTHQDMDSSFVHDGPDHGYIFGLTNLIKLLKEISKGEAD